MSAPSRRIQERRAQHQRYKEDVKREGKPFFPFAMWHDTLMSFVVVAMSIVLTVVWKYSIPDGTDGTEAGLLGPLYSEEADPGTINFVPRPDWYFYFLFYLLRIFKWPDSVILGTVGIPTILLVLLIALPFIDIRRERRLLRRPVAVVAAILVVLSMGVLTYKGASARESLGTGGEGLTDTWVARNNLPETARPGAMIFQESNCGQCHIYLGAGSQNLGAPELTAIGAEGGKGVDYFRRYVANPGEFGNNRMPRFASLGEQNLRNLAIFLDASKGPG